MQQFACGAWATLAYSPLTGVRLECRSADDLLAAATDDAAGASAGGRHNDTA